MDVQAGPFRFEADEAVIERQWWEIPAFKNTSTCGLRPGTLPRLANVLHVDEWSYYFAIDAPEDQALAKATALAKQNWLDPAFLRQLDRAADLLICHVDGWWEFYAARGSWQDRLRLAWTGIFERSITKAGTAPPIERYPTR